MAWLLAIALGIVVRLVIWWATVGSNDVMGWAEHAHNVDQLGLAETYRTMQLYNHPPLAGLYSSWVWGLAEHDVDVFARLIKLPGLLGEAIALLALGRVGGIRLAGLYALMPAPILVAAYHGNTDCLYAAMALLAALSWDRKRYGLAGLAMAGALNVKLIPLVLLPLFVIAAPSWQALARFSLLLGLGMLPYLLPVLQAGDAMYRNMIAYNSSHDEWGFLALLNDAELLPATHPVATPLRGALLWSGRYLIMGCSLAIALASRWRLRIAMREQVALAAAMFLFFAPGFGVQYVAFAAPLIFAVSAGAGVFWGVSSGVFVGWLYVAYLVPGDAWYSQFQAPYAGWSPEVGIVAWAGLGAWALVHVTRAWRESSRALVVTAAEPAAEPDA